MSSLKFASILLVVSLTFFACAGRNQTVKFDRYYFAVLDAQVESERTHEYHTMDRIFDLNRNSRNSDLLLTELLDYRLGAGGGEILTEFITEKGRKMLPLLKRKRAQPLNCSPKYESICIESMEARNEDIDLMIDAIEKGIVLWAVEPSPKR
jgi:hypothetical protein